MLEVSGLRQRYAGRTVLSVDSLALSAGERLAVVGPNGSGKSTLLRVLGFLERPVEGGVALDGRPVRTAAERRAARRRVTLVEQRPYLFGGTVLDNVGFGLRVRGVEAGPCRARALEALALLGAETLAERDARALSEGEVQRVAVARALATEPEVLLLDEPVSGADRGAQHALYAAIARTQASRRIAVVVASHQLEDAYRWADRLLALHEGAPSPITPENLFRVRLLGGSGMQRVAVGPMEVEVVSERSGPATLAIPPDEIVLSNEPLHSSARNVFEARVVRAAEQGAAVRLTLDLGGVELVALITRKSFEEMGLAVGGRVFASFKSVAVRVF
jgi:tungstate transport system ATP-binding protein